MVRLLLLAVIAVAAIGIGLANTDTFGGARSQAADRVGFDSEREDPEAEPAENENADDAADDCGSAPVKPAAGGNGNENEPDESDAEGDAADDCGSAPVKPAGNRNANVNAPDENDNEGADGRSENENESDNESSGREP
jgi:hypothetical protein